MQLCPIKALGIDGKPALFYQKYWHVMGDDVVLVTLSFLNNGFLLREMNKTVMVLISKVKGQIKEGQYRLISLWNVIYKIVARVLMNRLWLILDEVIFEYHNAFMHGRLISDNILMAAALLHTIQHKKQGKEFYELLSWYV